MPGRPAGFRAQVSGDVMKSTLVRRIPRSILQRRPPSGLSPWRRHGRPVCALQQVRTAVTHRDTSANYPGSCPLPSTAMSTREEIFADRADAFSRRMPEWYEVM